MPFILWNLTENIIIILIYKNMILWYSIKYHAIVCSRKQARGYTVSITTNNITIYFLKFNG